MTTEPELQPARHLLQRVSTRQFYSFVGECLLEPSQQIAKHDRDRFVSRMKHMIVRYGRRVCPPSPVKRSSRQEQRNSNQHDAEDSARPLEASDLELRFVNINYGMQNRNPVELVGFFRKAGPPSGDTSTASAKSTGSVQWSQAAHIPPERVSCLIPKVFSEQYLRLFVKQKVNNPPRADPCHQFSCQSLSACCVFL